MIETITGTKNFVFDEKQFVLDEFKRNEAKSLFKGLDYPTSKDEEWKYTRISKIKNITFTSQKHKLESVDKYKIENLKGSFLVFINGYYQENLSRIMEEDGLVVSPMSSLIDDWKNDFLGKNLPLEGNFFNTMNAAFATDGVVVKVKKSKQLVNPIQVLFLSMGEHASSIVRNLIVLEESSNAHVVLNYQSEGSDKTFNNVVSEIFVEKNAQLKIDKIQAENNKSIGINNEFVVQEKDSVFTNNTVTLDGFLVRNNLEVHVEGQNSETNLHGVYILKGSQHVDNHTIIDHKVSNCLSNELYKGVIDDQATGVFNGKVFVRKDAQKVNAFQSNGNVLLSDAATINSKPELEIYADDVKCSHGSTTGQLDDEAIFYLKSRGLSEKSARELLVSAFIGDVLDKIEDNSVREYIDRLISEKFGWTFL
jgi:Fe-S cluster assembly protein SufD